MTFIMVGLFVIVFLCKNVFVTKCSFPLQLKKLLVKLKNKLYVMVPRTKEPLNFFYS